MYFVAEGDWESGTGFVRGPGLPQMFVVEGWQLTNGLGPSEAISRHHWALALLPKARWQHQVEMTSGGRIGAGDYPERRGAVNGGTEIRVGHQGA